MTSPAALDASADRAASTWAALRQMQLQMTGHLNRELAAAVALSQTDLEVLVALLDAPEVSIRDMSLRCGLGWEKSRLSHQLRRMEARGLVTRGSCPDDGRGSTVSLTPAGRDAAQRGREIEAAVVDRYIRASATADQLQQLHRFADDVLESISAATAR